MPRQRPQRPKLATRETSLYLPVKRFLESLGFEVKGEICSCDLVAIRGEEPPLVVIGELKLGFNLELVLQGINRMAACDPDAAAASATRACANFAGCSVSACSACRRAAASKCWSSPCLGGLAAMQGAARASSTNIGGVSAIRSSAEAARRRS
jgi:hypothetical protein